MSTRRALISKALLARFRELCGERSLRFAPETFGEMSSFVSSVRRQLLEASITGIKNSLPGMSAPAGWLAAKTDCLANLRALSTGEPVELYPGQHPPLDPFIEALDKSRNTPARRFQLLAERYLCPLNFSHGAEDEARERILTRLMVHDRTRIERSSVQAIESPDDLLLRLNLVAVHAARVPDLRFLDALNYYYELLPEDWQPHTQHDWLLISYFALYARALAAWI